MKKLLNIFHLISSLLGIGIYDSFLQMPSFWDVCKDDTKAWCLMYHPYHKVIIFTSLNLAAMKYEFSLRKENSLEEYKETFVRELYLDLVSRRVNQLNDSTYIKYPCQILC